MEGYQWGDGRGRMGGKVQGIRSIIGRYRIDSGGLKIVWEALAGVAQWMEHWPVNQRGRQFDF